MHLLMTILIGMILAADAQKSCPVTRAPEPVFVPPPPFSPYVADGGFWFGSPNLWTRLDGGGTRQASYERASGYGFKMPWFREGYNAQREPELQLVITAQRLDESSGPVSSRLA